MITSEVLFLVAGILIGLAKDKFFWSGYYKLTKDNYLKLHSVTETITNIASHTDDPEEVVTLNKAEEELFFLLTDIATQEI